MSNAPDPFAWMMGQQVYEPRAQTFVRNEPSRWPLFILAAVIAIAAGVLMAVA